MKVKLHIWMAASVMELEVNNYYRLMLLLMVVIWISRIKKLDVHPKCEIVSQYKNLLDDRVIVRSVW